MQSFTTSWEDGLQRVGNVVAEKDGWVEELCQHRFRTDL